MTVFFFPLQISSCVRLFTSVCGKMCTCSSTCTIHILYVDVYMYVMYSIYILVHQMCPYMHVPVVMYFILFERIDHIIQCMVIVHVDVHTCTMYMYIY